MPPGVPPAAPARARRADAATNRVALVRAAQTVLARDPHASIDTIAREAGLSRRAVYGHFPDRDSLVRAVIAVAAERFNAIATSTLDIDPAIALATLAARLWAEAAQVQASASLAVDDDHVDETARSLGPLRERLRGIVDRGVADGAFRRDLPPALLARVIEEAARTALRELTDIDDVDARDVAVRLVLSVAGLSWHEASDLLSTHPAVLEED